MICNYKSFNYQFLWVEAKPQTIVTLWWRDLGSKKIMRKISEISEYLSLMSGFEKQGRRQNAGGMIQKKGEQMRNRKGKKSPGNQRSSRRTFCHNSLNVALIFTDVLPHDSHQFADTFIYTSVSAVCLSPKDPSLFTEFIPHPMQSL